MTKTSLVQIQTCHYPPLNCITPTHPNYGWPIKPCQWTEKNGKKLYPILRNFEICTPYVP